MMPCEQCLKPCRCLSTRSNPSGSVVRRYECPAGHRFSTVEAYQTKDQVRSADRAFRRVARDTSRQHVYTQVDTLLLQGHKPATICGMLSISDSVVYKRRRAIEANMGRKIETLWRRENALTRVAVPLFERLQANDDG